MNKQIDKKLFILYGSPSDERDVSISTKDFLYNCLSSYKPALIEWTSDFRFILNHQTFSFSDFLDYLRGINALIVIAGHGKYCEDGYIQNILEENGIEYTGSNSHSSELAMDKFKSSQIANEFMSTIPTYKTLINDFNFDDFNKIIGTVFPVFAKPNNSGSSIGVYKLNNLQELNNFIKLNSHLEYLFQPAINGVEVSMGCVKLNGKFLELNPTEIVSNSEFFDFEAKYSDNGAKEITPARIDTELTKNVRDFANKIHDKLGLNYYSRTDFIISENVIYYLETNSLPGLSKNSILPKQLREKNLIDSFIEGLIINTIKL